MKQVEEAPAEALFWLFKLGQSLVEGNVMIALLKRKAPRQPYPLGFFSL